MADITTNKKRKIKIKIVKSNEPQSTTTILNSVASSNSTPTPISNPNPNPKPKRIFKIKPKPISKPKPKLKLKPINPRKYGKDFNLWRERMCKINEEYQPRADYAVHVYHMKPILKELIHVIYSGRNIIL
jgi:hypothetical protein